jgi:hypothetical protein
MRGVDTTTAADRSPIQQVQYIMFKEIVKGGSSILAGVSRDGTIEIVHMTLHARVQPAMARNDNVCAVSWHPLFERHKISP